MGFDPARAGMSREKFTAMTQSPYLVGRAVAALVADPGVTARSGSTVYAGDVAREYNFTDIDGRIPPYEGEWEMGD
jgi:hypothetical protein